MVFTKNKSHKLIIYLLPINYYMILLVVIKFIELFIMFVVK